VRRSALAAQATLADDGAVTETETATARELYDPVLQRLFATGLTVQAAAGRCRDAEVAAALHEAVDELDATMRLIRDAIGTLGPHVATTGRAPTRAGRVAAPGG
jgi:signal transduction histidine kinase